MESTITQEEVRVSVPETGRIRSIYEIKQMEPFPRRRLWLGAFYAILFLGGGMCFYLFLFWLAMKIFNVN